jgi:hypothetical protein
LQRLTRINYDDELELRNSLLSSKVSWQRREPEAFALLTEIIGTWRVSFSKFRGTHCRNRDDGDCRADTYG